MDTRDLSPLFAPLRVRGKTYKNRVTASPLGNVMIGPDGSYPQSSFDWYEKRARGGCSEVMVSETAVDFDHANRLAAAKVDYRDFSTPHFRSLKKYADMLHSYGTLATVELNHCGANRFPTAGPLGPIGPTGYVRADGMTVKEMDEALMEQTAENFAAAARYFQEAGFDGVCPHMGSGWLLQQFLSPLTNHRQDEYGGSAENRVRFPVRVLRAIREACGEELLIIPRFCGDEGVPGGYDGAEGAEMARLMEPWMDMLHLVRGVYYEPVLSGEYSSMFTPHAPNAELSWQYKKVLTVPVILCGGISDPGEAADLIRLGKTDMIALGRQMLADPDWAEKAGTGRESDIAKCLRCFRCFPGPLQDTGGKPLKPPDKKCTVNPLSDLNELEVPVDRWPEPKGARHVLVVGGGPGGMMAAATAARRGHRVTLYEKESELGGHIRSMASDPHKQGFCGYAHLLERRCLERGVEIRRDCQVTPELLKEQSADVVIFALGSRLLGGILPGEEYALQAAEVRKYLPFDGKSALIIGGGLVGSETALELAQKGVTVTLLEMRDDIAVDANPMHRVALLHEMKQAGVRVITGAGCREILPDGAVYVQDGTETYLKADRVFTALGVRSRKNEAEVLASVLSPETEVFFVGDCGTGTKIQEATEQGFLAAMKII